MTESTNWRALCAELLDVIDFLCEGDTRPDSESVTRARAALAQPEPEKPSVDAMAQIVYENAMLATAPEHARPHWPSWSDLPNSDARIHSLNTAEIILTRWSRPTIKPVPQEVEELIQCLRSREHYLTREGASLRDRGDGIYFGRAADILTLLARPAIQPVPDTEGALEGLTDDDLPPRVGHILKLAEIIREVDGSHDKGAAALAEAILSHPGSRWGPAIEPVPVSERPWEREGWCDAKGQADG